MLDKKGDLLVMSAPTNRFRTVALGFSFRVPQKSPEMRRIRNRTREKPKLLINTMERDGHHGVFHWVVTRTLEELSILC